MSASTGGARFAPTAQGVYERFEAFSPGVPAAPWPPTVEDPFPACRGIPLASVRELRPELLGGAILHHGCLRIPELFDGAGVGRLRDAVTTALAAAQQFLTERTTSDWFTPFPTVASSCSNPIARKFGLEGGSVYAADSPLALEILVDEFAQTGVSDAIDAWLGEEAFLSVGKTSLRRVDPGIPTGWHQDGAFLGEHVRTVNLWIALSDCGEDAPGLDLLPRRVNHLCERGTEGAHFDWSIGNTVVEALAREVDTPIVSPTFKAGDALLFDQLFVHRTGVRPGMSRPRYAIEAWHFAGSTFPAKQIPIARRAGQATRDHRL